MIQDLEASECLLRGGDEKGIQLQGVPATTRTSLWSIVLARLPRRTETSTIEKTTESSNTPTKEKHENVYAALDGLRGLACLTVINQHYTQLYTDRLFLHAWRTAPTDVYIPQWPIVRILWCGSANVFTFFILSGFVLSIKPLKQMRSRSSGIHKTLASSIFRRGLRLIAPSAVVIIIVGIVGQLGAYLPAHHAYEQGLIASPENIVLPQASAWQMAQAVWNDICGMSNPWNWAIYMPALQQHLWTIGIEFRASMLLYLVQSGTSRITSTYRSLIGLFMVYFCARTGQSHILLFFLGMILSELHMIWQDFQQRREQNITTQDIATDSAEAFLMTETHDEEYQITPSPPENHQPQPRWLRLPSNSFFPNFHFRTIKPITTILLPKRSSPLNRLTQIILFILALYLLCAPLSGSASAPGYITLHTYLLPAFYLSEFPCYFFWTVGATLLLSTSLLSPDLSKFYQTRFALYFGKISYALYLVHGPIYHGLGYGLLPVWARWTAGLGGRDTQVGFVAQWLLGAVVCVPVVIAAAHVVWWSVDRTMVKVARWLERWMEDAAWEEK